MMPRLPYSLGFLIVVCCTLVLGIPPPEAGFPPGFGYFPVGAPSAFGYPAAKAQFNPMLPLFKGGFSPATAAVGPPAAPAPTPTSTSTTATTLPPAVNNLIAKYKAAASAFYPTMPVV